MEDTEPCPRCGGTSFEEHYREASSFEDDIAYTSYACRGCGLWYNGWRDKWLIDCASFWDEADAEEYQGRTTAG